MPGESQSSQFGKQLTRVLQGDRYATMTADERRRVDIAALGIAGLASLIMIGDGQGWMSIPIAAIFFAAVRMYAFDLSSLIATPLNAVRRTRHASSVDAAGTIRDDLLNAVLMPADIDAGWARSIPKHASGAIIVPCSRFALSGGDSVTGSVTIDLYPAGGNPKSEMVSQTIVVEKSREGVWRQFTAAKAAFGCGQWHLGSQTYDVESIAVETGNVDAVCYRLESHPTSHVPGPPWIVHGAVFVQGRVIVTVDHYQRGSEPDLNRTRRVVARVIEKTRTIAGAADDDDSPSDVLSSIHADLAPYFPNDDLLENLILEECHDPSVASDTRSIFHETAFAKSDGYVRGEQRVYRANADLYTVEMTSARFASVDKADAALRHDAERYGHRDQYGVRRVRLPMTGSVSLAVSGRVNLGHRGSRVASVWIRHDVVVTRIQGFALEVDPLPVVQTLAENVSGRAQ